MSATDPTFDAFEFGDLRELLLPGQEPDLIERLLEAFSEALRPKDFIARLWVRDLAVFTARAEFLRTGFSAMVAWVMKSLAAKAAAAGALADTGGNRAQRRARAKLAPRGGAQLDQESASIAASEARDLLGQAVASHLRLIGDLSQLELAVVSGQDRIVQMFDNRRREQLAAELAAIASGLGNGAHPGDLIDEDAERG
jgi:hypothetical protein